LDQGFTDSTTSPLIKMNQLCLLSDLTSSEWASWVQAFGSIAAIFGATFIAIWQSKKQHAISLSVLRAEHRLARTEAARALLSLSVNCKRALEHSANQFPDREAVHSIAEGQRHFDFNELNVIEGAVRSIPLHGLPHQLVPLTMIVSSTVRQFRENVELALQRHRTMDGAAFMTYFEALNGLRSSLALTCKDIEAEVRRAEGEA
jgi:hypothetical protein